MKIFLMVFAAGFVLFASTAAPAQWVQLSAERSETPGHNTAIKGYPTAIAGAIIYEVIDSALYRMTRSGELSATGLKDVQVLSVAMAGAQVFAGTNGDGVFRSADSGVHWTPVNAGLMAEIVSRLSVSDDTLYAATWDAGTWVRPIAEIAAASHETMPTRVPGQSLFSHPHPVPDDTIISPAIPKDSPVVQSATVH